MQVTRIQTTFRDDRGEITDILVKEQIEYVTLIDSRNGAVRGNHFHKQTTQWVYILHGRLKLLTRMPDALVRTSILEKGDLAMTVPWEEHAMIALGDAAFLVFTRGVRGGEDYEKDTYRLAEPLRE